jgi:hypothetical protein
MVRNPMEKGACNSMTAYSRPAKKMCQLEDAAFIYALIT